MGGNYGYGAEAMPGATLFSYVMFPLRIAFFSFFFCLLYPLMTVVALLRALYLRLVVGTTSQVLKYGTYPPPKPAADGTMMSPPGKHEKANHYPAQMRFTKPFLSFFCIQRPLRLFSTLGLIVIFFSSSTSQNGAQSSRLTSEPFVFLPLFPGLPRNE